MQYTKLYKLVQSLARARTRTSTQLGALLPRHAQRRLAAAAAAAAE